MPAFDPRDLDRDFDPDFLRLPPPPPLLPFRFLDFAPDDLLRAFVLLPFAPPFFFFPPRHIRHCELRYLTASFFGRFDRRFPPDVPLAAAAFFFFGALRSGD